MPKAPTTLTILEFVAMRLEALLVPRQAELDKLAEDSMCSAERHDARQRSDELSRVIDIIRKELD